MVSQVSFGNFFQLNGKTVLGGAGGSGIDTQSLINTLVTARSAQATQDQTQITTNNSQSTALGQFQQLISTFQSTADALRNPPGVGNEANNAFKFTTGSVSSNTAVSGSTYLSITTQPGAALQSYTVSDITQLAAAASQGTGTFSLASADASATTVGATAGMFRAGEIDFAGGAKVTLATGDSLNTVAAKFNAVSDSTGIAASVIQVDSSHFRMSFVATKTGTANSFDLTDVGTVTAGGAALANIGLTAAVAGIDANFSVNGIPLVRSSNNVNDVISGVTLNLLQITPGPGTQLTVSVNPDTVTVQNSIVNFVNAYNAIRTFAAQQTQLNSDGTFASTAVLAGNQTFRNLLANITQQTVSQVAGLSGLNSLGALGITFTNQPATTGANPTPEVDNILTVNDGLLSSELATNFSDVAKLFGVNLTADNPDVKLFATTNATTATSFVLDANPGGNSFTATVGGGAPITLTATPLLGVGNAVIGYTLAGAAGSALDGLQLIYGSTSSATVNVTLTQGVAAQIYNTGAAALTGKTGLVPLALNQLTDSTTQLNKDIANVNAQVGIYQQQLIKEFAALERAVSSVNSLLNSLNANAIAKQEAANIP